MAETEPVHLQADEQSGDHFLVYGTDGGPRIDIRYQGERLWMTQAQIAALFGRDVSVISRHITAILDEGELDDTNLHKMQISRIGAPTTLFSLDMVISVGYRVSSKQATLFRRWATDTLVRFATKGFVVDSARLKHPDNHDRIAELRDIIRDIRSDEANLYRELRQICSMCLDYDGTSPAWQQFYRHTQAKLVHAVTSNTPAEIIHSRADAAQRDMGLRTWPYDNIRKSDVTTSKNYLGQPEIKELNRLTEIMLGILEDQMDMGRLRTMDEATALLDRQLADLGRSVLRSGGTVTTAEAKVHAEGQFALYQLSLKAQRQAAADQMIDDIKSTAKSLPRGKR